MTCLLVIEQMFFFFRYTIDDTKIMVFQIISLNNLEVPFKDEECGSTWLDPYSNRHKEISIWKPCGTCLRLRLSAQRGKREKFL